MQYNIHPIFVHFPIALLFVYSVSRMLPLKRWVPSIAWRDIERVLLVLGIAGAFVALGTGDTAEHLVHPNRQLVEAHSLFGVLSTWIYCGLLLGEITSFIIQRYTTYLASKKRILQVIVFINRIISSKIVSITLAVAGIIAISVTGMLGGVIAYGVTADPLSPFLLKVLGIVL